MNKLYQYLREHHVLAIVEMASVNKMKTLNLSNYDLVELPKHMELSGDHLEKLYLQNNKIIKIPETLSMLVNIHTLTLDYNCLTEFPIQILQLAVLKRLNISGNKVRIIPPEIQCLTKLEVLWCNNTGLKYIPNELCECEQLITFGARGNCIKEIPEAFGKLKNLSWLTLENNQISKLPTNESIKSLSNLIHLNLKHNCLGTFPESLIQLKALRFCYLNSNSINRIDHTYLPLTSFMIMLNIEDNPFPDGHFTGILSQFPHIIYGRYQQSSRAQRREPDELSTNTENLDNVENSSESDNDDDWEHSVPTSELDTTDASETEQEQDFDPDLTGILPTVSKYVSTFN